MKEISYLLFTATDPGPAENPVPKPGPELPENPPPTIPPVEQPDPSGPRPADPGTLPPRAGVVRYAVPGLYKSFRLKGRGGFFSPFRSLILLCKLFVTDGNLSKSFCLQ